MRQKKTRKMLKNAAKHSKIRSKLKLLSENTCIQWQKHTGVSILLGNPGTIRVSIKTEETMNFRAKIC